MGVKHKDALVIVLVLLMAAAACLVYFLTKDGGGDGKAVAVIYVDGTEYRRVPLDTQETVSVEIRQDGGEINIVEVFPGGARMKYSSCKNQLCVHAGDVTEKEADLLDTGARIVCLPNKVVVEILKEG